MMLLIMGRATRRLREMLALAIFATWCSAAGAVGLVYVDAYDNLGAPPDSPYTNTISDQNLFAANGAFEDSIDAYGSAGANFTDGKWGYRSTGFAAEGTIYETANEEAPVIYQQITGLVPGNEYDVYVTYWSNTGGNWAIRAGSSPAEGANPIFDRTGALGTRGFPATYAAFDVLPQDNYTSADNDGAGVLTQTQSAVTMEGDRYMLVGKAGTFTADGSGNVRVYIDDVSDVHNQRSFFDGLAYAPKDTPIALTVEVNRETGNVRLLNPTSQDFRVSRLGINSTGGAIDPREWITIAGNTDANGDASRDADAWIVTNPDPNGSLYTRGTALREIEYDNAGAITLLSEGALIPAGTEIDLGNIWIQSPYEDLTVNLAPVLRLPARPTPEDPIPPYPAPDTAIPLVVEFVGGTSIEFGDFDYDGDIDVQDYQTLLSNMNRSFGSSTLTESFLHGDITGDRLTNLADMVAFATAYDGANGAGAFALVTGAQVPEPATLALIGLAACGIGLRRRWTRAASLLSVLVVAVAATAPADAQTVTYIDSEPSNTMLEVNGVLVPLVPGTAAAPPAGWNIDLRNGGTPAGDGMWGVRNFGNQSSASWGPDAPNPTFTMFESWSTENVDRLVTSFNLPNTGIYQIYGFIWSSTNGGWDARMQLGDGPNAYFSGGSDGLTIEAASFLPDIVGHTVTLNPGVQTANGGSNDVDQTNGNAGNRNMWVAPLGIWKGAVDGTSVSIAVDNGGTTQRTWFDGVGYAPVTDPSLILDVNRTTGEVRLSNPFTTPIEFSYYEIHSASGSLDRTAWNTLDTDGQPLVGWDRGGSETRAGDLNNDGSVDAADYVVWRNGFETEYDVQDYVDWKENFGKSGPLVDVNALSEVRLLDGVTTIAGGGSISLGNIYNTDIDGGDLILGYGRVDDGSFSSLSSYYHGTPGSLVTAHAVPEPSTLALAALVGLACAGFARRRNRA